MIIRNLTLTGISAEAATKCVLRLFESRKCSVTQSAADDVLQYSGLLGLSPLTQGYGFVAVVSVDEGVDIRIGLQTSLTFAGSLLGVFSLLASIPLIGLPLLLFLLLKDQAASRITYELDRLISEIHEFR